jgi:hypothetical protein
MVVGSNSPSRTKEVLFVRVHRSTVSAIKMRDDDRRVVWMAASMF